MPSASAMRPSHRSRPFGTCAGCMHVVVFIMTSSFFMGKSGMPGRQSRRSLSPNCSSSLLSLLSAFQKSSLTSLFVFWSLFSFHGAGDSWNCLFLSANTIFRFSFSFCCASLSNMMSFVEAGNLKPSPPRVLPNSRYCFP